MKNKTLFTVLGLAAVAGGLWYIFRPKKDETTVEPVTPPVILPTVSPVVAPVVQPVVPPVVQPTVAPTVPVPVIDQIQKFSIGTSVNTTKDTNLYKDANFTPLTDWWGDFQQIKKGEYLGTIQGKSGAFTIVANYSSNNNTGQNQLYILNGEMVKKN